MAEKEEGVLRSGQREGGKDARRRGHLNQMGRVAASSVVAFGQVDKLPQRELVMWSEQCVQLGQEQSGWEDRT